MIGQRPGCAFVSTAPAPGDRAAALGAEPPRLRHHRVVDRLDRAKRGRRYLHRERAVASSDNGRRERDPLDGRPAGAARAPPQPCQCDARNRPGWQLGQASSCRFLTRSSDGQTAARSAPPFTGTPAARVAARRWTARCPRAKGHDSAPRTGLETPQCERSACAAWHGISTPSSRSSIALRAFAEWTSFVASFVSIVLIGKKP